MSEAIWQYEHSVKCRAPRSFAWSYWTDVSNWERLEGNAVEWIKLEGPFAVGSAGATKMPEHPPQLWQIVQLEPDRSATIEMLLEGASFCNKVTMIPTADGHTLIIQEMSLTGSKAETLIDGMRIFEQNAPQGLKKLAVSIEEEYKKTL